MSKGAEILQQIEELVLSEVIEMRKPAYIVIGKERFASVFTHLKSMKAVTEQPLSKSDIKGTILNVSTGSVSLSFVVVDADILEIALLDPMQKFTSSGNASEAYGG